MTRRSWYLAGAAVIGLALLIGGCGSDDGASIANPSAAFCEDQGGTYSLDDETCTLPDGTVVDAWDYYREQTAEQ
jgi:putative hemolysin